MKTKKSPLISSLPSPITNLGNLQPILEANEEENIPQRKIFHKTHFHLTPSDKGSSHFKTSPKKRVTKTKKPTTTTPSTPSTSSKKPSSNDSPYKAKFLQISQKYSKLLESKKKLEKLSNESIYHLENDYLKSTNEKIEKQKKEIHELRRTLAELRKKSNQEQIKGMTDHDHGLDEIYSRIHNFYMYLTGCQVLYKGSNRFECTLDNSTEDHEKQISFEVSIDVEKKNAEIRLISFVHPTLNRNCLNDLANKPVSVSLEGDFLISFFSFVLERIYQC